MRGIEGPKACLNLIARELECQPYQLLDPRTVLACLEPWLRPARVSGDKGDSSHVNRRHLRRRGIRTTIPRKANEDCSGPFDRALDRLRHKVE